MHREIKYRIVTSGEVSFEYFHLYALGELYDGHFRGTFVDVNNLHL